ncbi:MAG: UDP-N-acetylmuramoyl-tripeptide--D-alanyl-D-alanine ligase [Kiritimatiellia bacterium]
MIKLNPQELAQACGGCWLPAPPPVIRGVTIDTRSLQPGMLFMALRGDRRDGHDFVRQALAAGAAGVALEAHHPLSRQDVPGPILVVPDTRRALREMAAAVRRSSSACFVGITGSAGKTTVKEMTADVLAVRCPIGRTRGNWNNDLGLPLSLLNMPSNVRAGVFEVGINHPGEMDQLCGILAPDWGVITCIGPVHIEFFGKEEAIAREKSRLLRALPANGLSIFRADDRWASLLRAAAPGRVMTVALDAAAGADLCAEYGAEGGVFIRERGGGRQGLQPPLPGRHNLVNLLLAAAAGRAWGLSWAEIIGALEGYRGQPMRWERRCCRGVLFVNDAYNANPLSMREALITFAGLTQPDKWLVLGDMLELGPAAAALHAELGRQVAGYPWRGVILVGPLAALVAEAAVPLGMPAERFYLCPDAAAAAEIMERELRPGDCVLLKGSRGVGLERALAWLKEPVEDQPDADA